MRQDLHLLIVDGDRRRVQAARYGVRWLLPTIVCGERARAGPLISRWIAARGLAGDVAGQWLGRVNGDSVDWLIAIAVSAPLPPAIAPLEWIDLASLTNNASVIDYQSWAIARCLERSTLPAVQGPFGTLDWPAQARAWIVKATGSSLSAWTPYRVSAHEVVLGVDTARGRVFFKGLSDIRATEAFVTRRLASLVPDAFAATLALERRANGAVWWLAGECKGRPSHDAALVGTALAEIQQQLMSSDGNLPELPAADLDGASRWVRARLDGAGHADVIAEAVDYVRRSDLPFTWIPMDLDPSNVLVDDGAVRFIDLDDSFAGPAALAFATFAAQHRDYEQAWSPPLKGLDWRRIRIAARAFQAWQGWGRFERNVAHGEVHADLDRAAAHVRARLDAGL